MFLNHIWHILETTLCQKWHTHELFYASVGTFVFMPFLVDAVPCQFWQILVCTIFGRNQFVPALVDCCMW